MPDGTNYTIKGKNPATESIPAQQPPSDPLADPSGPFTTVYSKLCGVIGGGEEIAPGGGVLQVFDEGGIVARTVSTLNYVGLGIQATSPDDINVTITVFDQPVSQQGIQQADNMASMDFVGGGVAVTADANGNCTVTIPEDAIQSVFGRTGIVVGEEGDYVLDQLGDVTITNATTGDAIIFDGVVWRNQIVSTVGALDDLTDVAITAPSSGEVLTYNGSTWVNLASAAGAQFLNDLLDVSILVTPGDQEVLTYNNGSGFWEPGAVPRSLDGLGDVTIPSPLNNQVLIFDEVTEQWVNANITDITSGNEFRQVQFTELGTDTPAVFDSVKTQFSIRQWDDITDPVFILNDLPENILLGLEGLLQHPRLHYSVSGSTLTFNTAPPADALYDARVVWQAVAAAPVDNYVLLGSGDNILLGNGVDKLKLGSTIA